MIGSLFAQMAGEIGGEDGDVAMDGIACSGEQHDVVAMRSELVNERGHRRVSLELVEILGLKFLPAALAIGVKPLAKDCRRRYVLCPQVIMKPGFRLATRPKAVDKHTEAAGCASGVVIDPFGSYLSCIHVSITTRATMEFIGGFSERQVADGIWEECEAPMVRSAQPPEAVSLQITPC